MKAIGGYFSWEFPMNKVSFPHEKGALVSSGHGAIQLILQSIGKISKLWIPYFTCDIVPDALKAIGVPYDFYHINFDLEIEKLPELTTGEYLLYTNYFGIMDNYVSALAEIYGNNLIIDNAQAFFAKEINKCHQIYRPRKFVGVPDGGMAVSPLDLNVRMLLDNEAGGYSSHLLLREEGMVAEGYEHFKRNDSALRNLPLTKMSKLTRRILLSLDYEQIIEVRRDNFHYLHSALADQNGFLRLLQRRGMESFACPMVYPFYTEDVTLRSRLIENKVFVAQYWPNVLEWCNPIHCEYALCNHILPLPIDQRYGREDMKEIIELINGRKSS